MYEGFFEVMQEGGDERQPSTRDHPFYDRGEPAVLKTEEPVEFEKEPVEVQRCRKITYHFRGIYTIYPNLMKEKPEDVNM